MDSKTNPVYEDFEVHTEWVHEAADDTLIANLSGFTTGQLKIQITTGGNLRISGERPIGGNKFSRFSKEIPIPSNCDQNKIRATFRGGMLNIKHPKLIVPADEKQEQPKPSAEVPKSSQNLAPLPQRPLEVPQKQSYNGPEKDVQEAPPKATMEKQTGEKTDGVAKEADNVSEKAPDKEKEMKDKANAANIAPLPQRPLEVPQKQSNNGPEKDVQEAPPKATMEKQIGEKTDGVAKEADNVSEKAPDKEKEMKDKTNAANESDKPMEKEKKTSTSGKRGKLGDSVQDAAEKENVETKKLDDGTNNYELGINYKQVLEGLTEGLKSPRKLMNMVLAVLLVVVLAVYMRNAIRSLRNY
ncbi:hypothetical protein REPUB_Repub05bG0135400 [Reevesia pubescens]